MRRPFRVAESSAYSTRRLLDLKYEATAAAIATNAVDRCCTGSSSGILADASNFGAYVLEGAVRVLDGAALAAPGAAASAAASGDVDGTVSDLFPSASSSSVMTRKAATTLGRITMPAIVHSAIRTLTQRAGGACASVRRGRRDCHAFDVHVSWPTLLCMQAWHPPRPCSRSWASLRTTRRTACRRPFSAPTASA